MLQKYRNKKIINNTISRGIFIIYEHEICVLYIYIYIYNIYYITMLYILLTLRSPSIPVIYEEFILWLQLVQDAASSGEQL